MNVTVGTFTVTNLIGRLNPSVEATKPVSVVHAAEAGDALPPAPPRSWLHPAKQTTCAAERR